MISENGLKPTHSFEWKRDPETKIELGKYYLKGFQKRKRIYQIFMAFTCIFAFSMSYFGFDGSLGMSLKLASGIGSLFLVLWAILIWSLKSGALLPKNMILQICENGDTILKMDGNGVHRLKRLIKIAETEKYIIAEFKELGLAMAIPIPKSICPEIQKLFSLT